MAAPKTRILPEPGTPLHKWLAEKGRADMLKGFSVSPESLEKFRAEVDTLHPDYTDQQKEAWAIISAHDHPGLHEGHAEAKNRAFKINWPVLLDWCWKLAVLVLLGLIAANYAHAQLGTSHIDVIQFVDAAGGPIKSFAAPFRIKCGTNLTCTPLGSQITLQPNGGLGTGITSLGGLTASVQLFATPGTSGTAPNWSSVTATHTLNLPLASAAGVTAGLLSKTDYDLFSGKESVLTFGTGLSRSVNTVSCLTASGAQLGCLAAADWSLFNGKQAALGFTPENAANKDAASGYAGLSAGSLLSAAQLPNPSSTTLGGIKSLTCSGTDKISALGTDGLPVCSADVSAGSPTFDQIGSGTNITAAMVVGSGASLRSAAGIFGMPNSTTLPGTCTVGDLYFDNDAALGLRANLCTATNTWTAFDNPFGTAIDASEVAADVATQAEIDLKANSAVTLTAGAGLSGGGDLSTNRSFATASDEADFLKSGALTCGAATQGKAQVHTTPLQYCDNAATPALQYAAYGSSTGVATSATALAADAANCSAGQAAGGVSTSGAAQDCTTYLQTVTAHNLLSTTHGDTVAASPVLGDVLYGNSTPAWQRLAGNTTGTRNFLTQTGTGVVSAAPIWGTIADGDLPASIARDSELHAQSHVLADTTGLGTDHTTSGLTAGQVLRASTATAAAFAAIQPGDLPSHNAATATALAANGGNCSGNNFALGVDAGGVGECAQPDFSNLSGSIADGQIPASIARDSELPTVFYHTVQNEGTGLTQRRILNFLGAGVDCADDTVDSTDCTITGGGGGGTLDRMIQFEEAVVIVSGSPTVATFDNVAVTQLPNAANSEINVWFRVPPDAVVTQDIFLMLNFAPNAAPGTTNNKVLLKTTARVNNTSAAQTAGDTITLANDTNWASSVATANKVVLSTYAVGDLIQMKILRDTTVANNAAVAFNIGKIAFRYKSSQ